MQYAQFSQYHEFYVPASRCVLLVGGSVINGSAGGAGIRPPAVRTRPPANSSRPVARSVGRWNFQWYRFNAVAFDVMDINKHSFQWTVTSIML